MRINCIWISIISERYHFSETKKHRDHTPLMMTMTLIAIFLLVGHMLNASYIFSHVIFTTNVLPILLESHGFWHFKPLPLVSAHINTSQENFKNLLLIIYYYIYLLRIHFQTIHITVLHPRFQWVSKRNKQSPLHWNTFL